jgi:hypothetical protein
MMSAPVPDDLAGGPSRDPIRLPGWVRAVALVVLAGLAGWILVARGDPPTPAAGHPAPSRADVLPTQRAVVLGSPPGLLGIRAVCVRRDRNGAWLGVDLVNGRLARTTLLDVAPVAGAAGSAASEPVLPARRTCDRRPTATNSLVMLPGGIVPLQLRLRLPYGCGGAPASVPVDVSFLGPGERPETQRFNLHPDPGELAAACRGD